MKNLILSLATLITITACGQADKSQRPSPPAVATETLDNGTVVTIDYSQPSVKGRKVGTELAPYGKVWRTGANEITVFEISKDAKVEGQSLAAGKYGLFSIPGEAEWVIIFSKTSKGWGTQYKEADDAIRVKVKPGSAVAFAEKMTFTVNKSGKVSLMWADTQVDFNVN